MNSNFVNTLYALLSTIIPYNPLFESCPFRTFVSIDATHYVGMLNALFIYTLKYLQYLYQGLKTITPPYFPNYNNLSAIKIKTDKKFDIQFQIMPLM